MNALYRLALALSIATTAVGLNALCPSQAHAEMSMISGTWQSNYGPTIFWVMSPVRDSAGNVPIEGRVYFVSVDEEDGETLILTGEYATILGWLQYDQREGYRLVFNYSTTLGDRGVGKLMLRSDYTLTGTFQSRQDSSISGEWDLWGYEPAEHPGHPN